MTTDYTACLGQLRDHDLLPDGHVAAYASGSIVRGWGNPSSDFDVYVVTATPWAARASTQYEAVALSPGTVPVEGAFVSGGRWDIEYWLDGQIDQLLDKVSHARLATGEALATAFTDKEIGALLKLRHSALIDGEQWWRARTEQLAASAVDAVMALRALQRLDTYSEDATGQLAVGDVENAVLSAKLAWQYAIEAMLASCGEFSNSTKWLVHRFRLANPKVVDFDEYWAVETMRSYDPAQPEAWVEEVLRLCQRVATEVVVDGI